MQPLQQLQIHWRLHHHESEVVAFPSLAFRSLPSGDTVILGWGEKLELKVSSIIFCFVLALSTTYLFYIGVFSMYVLATSRQ